MVNLEHGYEFVECTLNDCEPDDYVLPCGVKLIAKVVKKNSNGNVTLILNCHFSFLADKTVLSGSEKCLKLVFIDPMLKPLRL